MEVADGSIFCSFCGERLARKKKGKKEEIKVPKPRQLKSGAWNIELRKEGESITEATAEACTARARAVRAGFLKIEKAPPKQSLKSVIRKYIDDNEPVLAVDTVRSYESMIKSRFKAYMDMDISSIPWQEMISAESKEKAPKTVLNGWRMVTAALNYAELPVPKVNLPQKAQEETEWLDYEQIQIFIKAIRDKSCERACLLALHSLRISEIRALEPGSIRNGVIRVRGAVVPDKSGKLVYKQTNKNDPSRRDIQVMIPRLLEIWPTSGEIKFQAASPLRRQIERICEKNDLPIITIHGLRHSFASLAYHLRWDEMTTCAVGGWGDPTCVHRIYTHLSKLDKNDNIEKMKQFYNSEFTNGITNENQKCQ
ncbi:MAG: site-specific integrase [Treponema sp.]|nr:site-specific integrase [Candidatus Treponema caballi]